ncbi:MAG: aminoacetone oxidase family FAD-binding enzyme [Rikenellaceae bacterium]
MDIAIIGGGAAGYFAAINIMEMLPTASVTIFEGGSRSLAKVLLSGGGRCNLTNTFNDVVSLERAYPRGAKLMKRAFRHFNQMDAVEWFERRGVALTAQSDECIFPVSQSSQEVVDCLVELAHELDVEVKHSHSVELIHPLDGGVYELQFADPKLPSQRFDRVVVTTGGSPQLEGFAMLSELDLAVESPCPSLFTFNLPNDPITHLMGTVVERAEVSLLGSKLSAEGALLITHWGMSGPAVLRLSSYGARFLADRGYEATLAVNWVCERSTERVMEELRRIIGEHGAKLVTSVRPFDIPTRLWMALLIKSGVAHERRFAELGSKGLNRLVNTLTNDEYRISGQSRFREEFVTCGGVSMGSIDMSSCESRRYRGVYFAGEVLDVDAITGGFNLQAAWSTAFVVARSIANAGVVE